MTAIINGFWLISLVSALLPAVLQDSRRPVQRLVPVRVDRAIPRRPYR